MRYLITVPTLTLGSGLSRYVFTLCEILAFENEVYVMTTHDDGKNKFGTDELMMINHKIHLISLGKYPKLFRYFITVYWIKRIRPDIIINNYDGLIQMILPFVSKKSSVIHVLHNNTDDFYRIGAINGRRVHSWIAPTEAICANFNKYTSNQFADRVKVIAHGVEDAQLRNKSNERFEILYTGVLYEHKGVKLLPSIIKGLRNAGIDFHFTIVGGGKLDSWLKEQFANEIEDGSVTMTGVIDHDNVYAIMGDADVFLYPTYIDAFGLVIAEAMMNGAVPVVTHLPGITDNLIDNGIDGFLVKQDDIHTFISAIIQLYDDVALRNKLSVKTRKKAHDKLSYTMMRHNYLNYFSTL